MLRPVIGSVIRRALMQAAYAAVCLAAGLSAPWRFAVAQRVASERHTLVLVTVDVDNAPLLSVLRVIASQAGLTPVYHDALIDARARITLHVRNVPVTDAFQRALAGTGLVAQVQESGNVAILRAEHEPQGGGTIEGQLRDAGGTPVSHARVVLRGTSRVTESKEHGEFRFTNVPPGTYTLVATRLGLAPTDTVVALTGAFEARVTVTLTMRPLSTRLTEVVTTATGNQERLKVGNDVGTINADSLVQNTLVRSVSDLLTGHTPGVQATSTSGAVGAPTKIRVRGVTSSQLNNDPIVIVDGVRVNAQSTVNSVTYLGGALSQSQVNTGSQYISNNTSTLAPSPLDQIDPNMIESIDVLKGPTATALYGPDASSGVIVIKTKQGKPGPWRYHVSGDDGWLSPLRSYPAVYTGWGHAPGTVISQPGCPIVTSAATLSSQTNGGCVLDSVTAFNPLNDPQMTNLGTGHSHSIVADASGGGTTVQGFLQGDYSEILGQEEMPLVEQRRLAQEWTTPVPSWMIRPNEQSNTHVTTKVDAHFTPQLDVSAAGQATYQATRNDGTGITTSLLQGVYGPGDTLEYAPAENLRGRGTSSTKRGVGSTNARFQPASWLVLTGAGGLDYSLRDDESLVRSQDCTAQINLGGCSSSHNATHTEVIVPSFNVGATFTYDLSHRLSAHTAFGEQFSRVQTYIMGIGAAGLNFGTDVITGASSISTPTEGKDASASAGWYAEQQFGLNQRLFLTAGVRRDASSSFGSSISTPTFPKFSASWVVSNEPLFPQQSVLTQVRLRAAYGESGKQGAQTDVLRNFLYTTGLADNVSGPSLVYSGVGNSLLQPQRDREWEGGADLGFWNDRATLAMTWYHKASHNAIISVDVAPSLGATVPIQTANAGDVRNDGYELQLSIRPVDTRLVTWDLNVQTSVNHNLLLNQGNLINLPANSGGRIVPGYPLFGLWERPIVSYGDYNHDGILEGNEIVFGDSSAFVGSTDPDGTIDYANSLTLFGGWVRLNSLVNQVKGLTTLYKDPGARGRVDPAASLADQAAALQAYGTSTYNGGAGGYMGTVSYISLAELSASFTLPATLVRRLRSQSATLTVAGRNLALKTNYRGADPMTNNSGYSHGGDGSTDDGTGLAQPRSWVVRLNLMF
jgi:TonB-dependent SusC/RagA subfamily outer membrane receptor